MMFEDRNIRFDCLGNVKAPYLDCSGVDGGKVVEKVTQRFVPPHSYTDK